MPIKSLVYRIVHPLLRMYWFLFRPHTYGVKVMIQDGDRLLLIRNSYGNSSVWTFPGGAYQPQRERAEDAARREVREELGLELSDLVLVGACDRSAEYKQDHISFFVARAQGVLSVSAEVLDARYFTQEECLDISTGELYTIGVGYLTNK